MAKLARKTVESRSQEGSLLHFSMPTIFGLQARLQSNFLSSFVRNQLGLFFSQYIEIDAQGVPGKWVGSGFSRGQVSGPLLVFNFVGFSTSVVRKQCFDRLGYFREDLGMGIDYELWLRFSTDYEFD